MDFAGHIFLGAPPPPSGRVLSPQCFIAVHDQPSQGKSKISGSGSSRDILDDKQAAAGRSVPSYSIAKLPVISLPFDWTDAPSCTVYMSEAFSLKGAARRCAGCFHATCHPTSP